MDRSCCLSRTTLRSARGNRQDRPKETRRRPLLTSARCVRHETSCSRCHATPCTIDLRKLFEGCRHYAVCFEVVLLIFPSVRRLSEIHEVSLRGASFVFQLVLIAVHTSFQLWLPTVASMCHLPATIPSSPVYCCFPRSNTLRLLLIVRVSHCCVRCT